MWFVTAVSDLQLHLRDVALGTLIPIDMTATMLTEPSSRVQGTFGAIGVRGRRSGKAAGIDVPFG